LVPCAALRCDAMPPWRDDPVMPCDALRLGKQASGEPELHYCKLPDVQNHAIIVMEPTIATGAAAMMAIRVLLDHGAKQEDIIVTCLVAANIGVHALANAFPNVRLIVSAIDEELSESYEVLPGLGACGLSCGAYCVCGRMPRPAPPVHVITHEATESDHS